MKPLIQVRSLGKQYRLGTQSINAVSDVSVEIARGDMVAVMGPSGSGKSTFMNLLGGLDQPTRGTIAFDGVDMVELDINGLAALRNRKIGFVFQAFNLLPRETALVNVELPMIYAGVSRRARRAKAQAALAALGLGERLDHLPSQLSGGQQQRVAIARALVNDPLLILADEPTGALDSRTSLEIMALLQALNAAGKTIVIVTHEPEIARFARRLLSFRDGRLIADHCQQGAIANAALSIQAQEMEAA